MQKEHNAKHQSQQRQNAIIRSSEQSFHEQLHPACDLTFVPRTTTTHIPSSPARI
jgi:hypothetical protein